MLFNSFFRSSALLVATLVLTNVVNAQVITIPPGGTNAGTSGNDYFVAMGGSFCPAYLNGGADVVIMTGDPNFGSQASVDDCENNDYVHCFNGQWDYVRADVGDTVVPDWFDSVTVIDCVTGEELTMLGEEYWFWYFDRHGRFPWEPPEPQPTEGIAL